MPETLSQAKNSYICLICNGKYTTRNKATHSKTKKHILALNKNNSDSNGNNSYNNSNNSNNNTRNLTCIEERANELREEFEIIQKILDKSVRNMSNDEIDILVKIRTGNTRSVPITSHSPPTLPITSHSPPTPPILTHSPKPSDPARPEISLAELLDAKKRLRNVVKNQKELRSQSSV